jgi:hypothetical protein
MGRIAAALIAAWILPLSAVSAGAQPADEWGGRPPTAYVDGLQWQIDTAAKDGRISWDQHRWLQRDLNAAKPLAWKVQTNTATPYERERLDRYVSEIEGAVRVGGEYRGYYWQDPRNANPSDQDWPDRGWRDDVWPR